MKDNKMGIRIARRRSELGLSQTQLAERTGYSDKTAISKIENGISQLNQSKIVTFAEALQTTPAYLMGWVNDPNLTREEVIALEKSERAKAYTVLLRKTIESSKQNGVSLPEEMEVAFAYRSAPQHIKDAIKALLQIGDH